MIRAIISILLLVPFLQLANAQQGSAIVIDKEDFFCDQKGKAQVVSVKNAERFEDTGFDYLYKWIDEDRENRGNTKEVTGLDPGRYTVIVTDANGCSGMRTIIIVDECTPYHSDLDFDYSNNSFLECVLSGTLTITLSVLDEDDKVVASTSQTVNLPSNATIRLAIRAPSGKVFKEDIDLSYVKKNCARDPNDITGPTGIDEQKWVSVNDKLPYKIRFENVAERATAPAQRIEVNHIFDEDVDLFSLQLGDFGFANLNFKVPPNTKFYQKRLDTRQTLGVYVDVTAGLDVVDHKVFWIFEAIDPLTGLSPRDPNLGVLPVNDSTFIGEGYVDFIVQPEQEAETGSIIYAKAEIIFDINEVIPTNTIFNTIDAWPPSSEMLPVVNNGDGSYTLSWSGADDEGGSGLDYYNLFVSVEGGPFFLLADHLPADSTSFKFIGQDETNYEFFVRATDRVGNMEDAKFAGIKLFVEDDRRLTLNDLPKTDFCVGETLDISWEAENIDQFNILFSADGGANFSVLEESSEIGNNHFSWSIPTEVFCNSCLLRLESVQSPENSTSVLFSIHLPPNADAGPDQSICEGESTTLLARGGFSYQWEPALGLSDLTIANPRVQPTSSQQEYVIEVTDASGCSATDSVIIFVNPKPVNVAFTGLGPSVCENEEQIALHGFPVGGSFAGPGISANVFDPVQAGVGTHQIQYWYFDENQCSDTVKQDVQVLASPVVFFYGLDSTHCAQESAVSLTGVPEGGVFIGPGVTDNQFFPNQLALGQYDLSYRFTDHFGCTSSFTRSTRINETQAVNITGVSDTYCENEEAIELAGIPQGGHFSGSGVLENGYFDPSLAGLGEHKIFYNYVAGDLCRGVDSLVISVMAAPNVFLGEDRVLVEGDSILLDAGQGEHWQYLWSTGATTPSIWVDTAGVYTISVKNENGCAATDEITIRRSTPVRDLNYFSELSFSPNPTAGLLQMNAHVMEATVLKLSIFDVEGKLLYQQKLDWRKPGVYTIDINLSDYAEGVYFVEISNGYMGHTEKIVKSASY